MGQYQPLSVSPGDGLLTAGRDGRKLLVGGYCRNEILMISRWIQHAFRHRARVLQRLGVFRN